MVTFSDLRALLVCADTSKDFLVKALSREINLSLIKMPRRRSRGRSKAKSLTAVTVRLSISQVTSN